MPDKRTIRRILLVSLDNVGDLVFASSLTPPLHSAFPDATIEVWCKAYTAPIAPLIPHVAHVISADPPWAVVKGRRRPPIVPFLRSIAAARRRRYDAAVLSQAPWRTAAAVAAAGIPVRVGFQRHRNARFLTHVVPAENAVRPVVDEQMRLLASLGVTQRNACYALDARRLGALRDEVARELPERFLAVHAFAGDTNRCMPLSEWTQLAFAMQAKGISVLWIGTSAELTELRKSYTHPRGFYADQIHAGSLDASAAALSLATAFVGHDSGPLHIAAAFGVPVVGVFAPGQPDRTFPQGTGAWRMIRRPSPAGITTVDVLREIDALGVSLSTR